jgi:ribonuclease P protein component
MQRHLRLRRRQDFDRLRQSGRVWRHPWLILSVTPNRLPHNRYGFVTGRGLGNAVRRNRIRRLLREAVRAAHPGLRQGYDVAFIARSAIVGQPYQAIDQAVRTLLQQADLREAPPGEQPI